MDEDVFNEGKVASTPSSQLCRAHSSYSTISSRPLQHWTAKGSFLKITIEWVSCAHLEKQEDLPKSILCGICHSSSVEICITGSCDVRLEKHFSNISLLLDWWENVGPVSCCLSSWWYNASSKSNAGMIISSIVAELFSVAIRDQNSNSQSHQSQLEVAKIA